MWRNASRVALQSHGSLARTSAPLASAAGLCLQRRNLKVHEYVGAQLMEKHGVPVARGRMASTVDEVKQAAEAIVALGSSDIVVKSQILAGGRGKGTFKSGFHGGVHIASSVAEAVSIGKKMLNETLVTKQTGASGQVVTKLFLTERLYVRKERYFAVLLDRETGRSVMVGCAEGGMNIEEVAEETPEKIIKAVIDPTIGVTDEQLDHMAEGMLFDSRSAAGAKAVMKSLYEMSLQTDATQIEINPLAETPDGGILCLDAKFNFDDNAAFRQADIFAMRDETQEDPKEVAAREQGYEFIALDGQIGCMVNGAGLAMATMDIIKLHGGEPANFLDLGGGATEAVVADAFKVLNDDVKVKAILVNIFGGIMRCDTIALGLIRAATVHGVRKPVVIRLAGTNVKEAMELIEESGMRMMFTTDLDLAARKAVRVANIVSLAEDVDVNVRFELPV